MTHKYDLGKFRKNNGRMQMSASKRKSGSEVEENRVRQAGGPGAMSHTGMEESEELERKSPSP